MQSQLAGQWYVIMDPETLGLRPCPSLSVALSLEAHSHELLPISDFTDLENRTVGINTFNVALPHSS